jgi:hypothetical protein
MVYPILFPGRLKCQILATFHKIKKGYIVVNICHYQIIYFLPKGLEEISAFKVVVLNIGLKKVYNFKHCTAAVKSYTNPVT